MPARLPFRCYESTDDRLASVEELEGLLSDGLPARSSRRRAATPPRALPVFSVWTIWVSWVSATTAILWLGGAFDLELSTAWADYDCGWGNLLAEWGEWPGYSAAGLSALVLLVEELAAPPAELRKPRFAAKVLALTLVVLFTVIRRTESAAAGCALGVIVPCCLVLPRGAEGKARLRAGLHRWRSLAVHIVLLFLIAGGVLEAIKESWGRARPRMVLAGSSLAAHGSSFPVDKHCQPVGQYQCTFSPWWESQGHRKGLQSFPSGHAFSAWMLLPVALQWPDLPCCRAEHEYSQELAADSMR